MCYLRYNSQKGVFMANDLGKTSTGMQPNVAALLSYVLGVITGIIFFIIEKENKFVKFHALQALILGIVEVICFIVISVILGMIPYVGWFLFSWLGWVLGAVCYVFAIIAIIKSFQGEKYYIPFLRGLVNKFNK